MKCGERTNSVTTVGSSVLIVIKTKMNDPYMNVEVLLKWQKMLFTNVYMMFCHSTRAYFGPLYIYRA